MKTSFNFCQLRSLNFRYALITVMFVGVLFNDANSQNCGSEPLPQSILDQMDLPNCSPENEPLKCVRLKFHHLNKTNNPNDAPSDAYYYNLLQKVNEALRPGNLKVTFDYNCIHREDLDQNAIDKLNNTSDISTLLADITISPQMAFDEDAFNIYSIQGPISGFYQASPGGHWAVVDILRADVVIHEIGHLFGVGHTFKGDGNNNVIIDMTNNCKDPTETFLSDPTLLLCEVVNDACCDTGTDPFTFDVDGNNEKDKGVWVDLEYCFQKETLLSSYADGCGNTTLDWNIPISNYMSYYGDCRTGFSPCQLGRMHERLNMPEFEDFLLDPANDPYLLCSAPDITINSETTWTNLDVELCPSQKIIITKNGFLTLSNTTIKSSNLIGPNTACPDLFGSMWDGIYLEGKGATVLSGGQYITLGGLEVINGSKISQSENGIQGLKGFGTILIDNSTFEENLEVLSVRDYWPLTFGLAMQEGASSSSTMENYTDPSLCGFSITNPYPKVVINNSTLTLQNLPVNPFAPTQIKVDGGSLYFTNSEIINPNTLIGSDDLTAIKSNRGVLQVSNGSEVRNFDQAIYKGGDIYNNCLPRGLYVYHSSAIGCGTSIMNTSQFCKVKHSFLEGDANLNGFGYSDWECNSFWQVSGSSGEALLNLQSPEMSCLFDNNCLTQTTAVLYDDNEGTRFNCTTWEDINQGAAVFAELGSSLAESWGGGNPSISSGNRHLDSNGDPLMLSDGDGLINYYESGNAQESFSYFGISGQSTTNSVTCDFDCCPEDPPTFNLGNIIESYNINSLNDLWLQLDSLKTANTNLLDSVPISQRQGVLEEIDILKNKLDAIVGDVLLVIDTTEEHLEDMWLSRASDKLEELSQIRGCFYGREFHHIDTLLSTSVDNDALAFLEAVDYLQALEQSGTTLYELDQIRLDSLSVIAKSSYGNYTNILRDFLNITYDLSIFWPTSTISPRSTIDNENSITDNSMDEGSVKFVIYPNPTNGCFSLHKKEKHDENISIIIFNAIGNVVFETEHYDWRNICLKNAAPGIYFIAISCEQTNYIETLKILVRE